MKCPKCGIELEGIYIKLVMSKDETKFIEQSTDTPVHHVCRNESCEAWFCICCDKWHSYNTSCSVAQVNGYDVTDQEDYDKWCKEHKEDIFKMLKDSGYWISDCKLERDLEEIYKE